MSLTNKNSVDTQNESSQATDFVSAILSPADLAHLEKVIGEIEQQTAGELRLMVVKSSSSISHVTPLLWAMLTAFTYVVFFIFHRQIMLSGYAWIWDILGIVYLPLAWWLGRTSAIRRFFTNAFDRNQQVMARAEVEFYRQGLTGTEAATGILLFVSLMEHQAVVLADKSIAQKLDAKIWDQVVAKMLEGGKTGKWSQKLEEAIRICGQLLQSHFPVRSGDRNELHNAVIVKV